MTNGISQHIEGYYARTRRTIRGLFAASAISFSLPIWYEATIGFVHIKSLTHLSMASIVVILIFLSGFFFGSAYYLRKHIRQMEGMF